MSNIPIYQLYSTILKDIRSEKEKSTSFAKRIKKVPDSVNIPIEYLVKKRV